MNHDIQHTLLHLCDQIIAHPETLPAIPEDVYAAYPDGSDERHLLQRFHAMLNTLNSREAQYLNIFDATTDALIVNNLDGYVVEANTAACTLLGYTRDEFIGMHYTAFIPAGLHSFVARYLKKVLSGGQLQTRTVGIRKDGSLFHAETQGTPFMYQGKLHILSAFRDVTERLHTEEQLREKEEQYRAIFEASTDALFIQDMEDGRIVEVNPAACTMHGFSYEEFIGLLPSAFIHPSSASLVAASLQTIQSGGTYHGRGTSLRKDGTTFLAEAHVTMFTYKGKPHLLSVVRDITEEVAAEQQLKEQEAQYRSIFEATTDGLFITDPDDGHLVEVNPAAYQMHGYTYDEFLHMHPTSFIHPDSHPAFAEYIQTVKAGGQFHARAVDVRKDGTEFPIEVHGTQFIYKGRTHVLGIVRDITEQERAYQLLEQRVEERTRELSTLLEVSHNVAATIELQPLVGLILQKLQEIVNYGGAALAILEDNDFTFLDYYGPLPQEQLAQMRHLFKHSEAHQHVLRSGEPLIISDMYDSSLLAQSLRRTSRQYLGEVAADYMHSWMGIPLKSKERVIGLLSISSPQPNFYMPQHARMAMGLASQAAVAIENARLYEQAQELAAIQERQRLARELHDSVSQALYGISLGTHTARTLLDRDPQQVAEPLDYVLSLAEAALVEMRALIFELRPESLETEGLVSALTKQAAAMHARYSIEVVTSLCDEPDVSLKVKQELHRVAQEALHNIVKHAGASKVELRLSANSEGIFLEVEDNGAGFQPETSFPGHLGLRSMRERIANLGGRFQIESAPGHGTRINAWIPAEGIFYRKTGALR